MSFVGVAVTIIYLFIFAFIYGQVFGRILGLRKPIDHWILFFLHNTSTSVLTLATGYAMFSAEKANDLFFLIIAVIIKIVFEGFIWQFYLKDRKLNGFLCSLICNAVLCTPIIVMYCVGI